MPDESTWCVQCTLRNCVASKTSIQPVLFVKYFSNVPETIWPAHLYLRHRLGIKITLADTGATIAGFDEAHSFAGELARRALACPRMGDVVRHDLSLAMGEHAGLRQRTAHLERYGGDVAERENVLEFCLQCMAVNGNPAAFVGQACLAHYRWRAMRRDIKQQVVPSP